jgi:hypothetical protein
MRKRALWALAPLVAIFSPIAFFSAGDWWADAWRAGGSTATHQNADLADLDPTVDGAYPGMEVALPAAASPTLPLSEALRFDVSTDWIVARWPRVSAALGQLQLQGYRVPLVTGTAENDVAGALTYYFNPRQQVQRITFYGTTGNAREIVDLVTRRFGLARRLTNDPSVFLYEIPAEKGKSVSQLWIRPAPVLTHNDPYRRFEVAMVLERPPA